MSDRRPVINMHHLHLLPLPWAQKAIIRALIEHYPEPVTYEQIYEFIYRKPMSGETYNSIRITKNRLNDKLTPLGWEIVNTNPQRKGMTTDAVGKFRLEVCGNRG